MDKKIMKRISGIKDDMTKEAEIQVAQVVLEALDDLKKDICADLLDYKEQFEKEKLSQLKFAIVSWQAENFKDIIKRRMKQLEEEIKEFEG